MAKRSGLNVIHTKGKSSGDPQEASTEEAPERKTKRFTDRTQLTIYLRNDAYQQLRVLAAELSHDHPVKVQDLLRLGVDMVFERYDKPRIAGAPDDPENP